MSVYTEEGDTIVGDVLVGEARKVSKPAVIVKTGRHKAQRIVPREAAKCRIEKKVRFIG